MTMRQSHLGALIEQQQLLNNLSYSDIARRAQEQGEKLGKSNIGRVASGENPSLSRATIYGLAAGLGVTAATVARAALADMGIILAEQGADSETAIRTDSSLSEHARRLLLTMLAQLKSDDPVPLPRASVLGRSNDDHHEEVTTRIQKRRQAQGSKPPSPPR